MRFLHLLIEVTIDESAASDRPPGMWHLPLLELRLAHATGMPARPAQPLGCRHVPGLEPMWLADGSVVAAKSAGVWARHVLGGLFEADLPGLLIHGMQLAIEVLRDPVGALVRIASTQNCTLGFGPALARCQDAAAACHGFVPS